LGENFQNTAGAMAAANDEKAASRLANYSANESISIPPSVRIKIERVRGEEKFFLPPDIWRVYHSVPVIETNNFNNSL
jgi:hypothetical protein